MPCHRLRIAAASFLEMPNMSHARFEPPINVQALFGGNCAHQLYFPSVLPWREPRYLDLTPRNENFFEKKGVPAEASRHLDEHHQHTLPLFMTHCTLSMNHYIAYSHCS